MNDNLQTVLQFLLGKPVTVYLQLTDGSTGRTGTLDKIGADYLIIIDSSTGFNYLIPFNAITMIQASAPRPTPRVE
jgi:hypothetical protein